MAKSRRVFVKLKGILKRLNCCSSQCFNKTIENIEYSHVEELYNVISQLQSVITQMRDAAKPEVVSV